MLATTVATTRAIFGRLPLREGRHSGQCALIVLFLRVVLVSTVHYELRGHHLELDVGDHDCTCCGGSCAIWADVVDTTADYTVRILDHDGLRPILES